MCAERPSKKFDPQVIACPACTAEMMFSRSRLPHIDARGFESYSLECKDCGTALSGIIDPSDEALLLGIRRLKETSRFN